ncbi:MAG: hypothetical protein WAM95_10790 [Bacillus sp. (in: firmicutes)]
MARMTDEERLKDLEKKIEQIKVQKQQVESRLKEKQRKERTRRLIQIGAIFEKYFDIADVNQAEKIAFALKKQVENNKEKILSIDLEKYKEKADRMDKEG